MNLQARKNLYSIMGVMRDIRVRDERTQAMFTPLKETVALLKQYGVPVRDETLSQLDDGPTKWKALDKKKKQRTEALNSKVIAEQLEVRSWPWLAAESSAQMRWARLLCAVMCAMSLLWCCLVLLSVGTASSPKLRCRSAAAAMRSRRTWTRLLSTLPSPRPSMSRYGELLNSPASVGWAVHLCVSVYHVFSVLGMHVWQHLQPSPQRLQECTHVWQHLQQSLQQLHSAECRARATNAPDHTNVRTICDTCLHFLAEW